MSQSLKDAAKKYASRGIAVFPLHHPRPDGSCSCGNSECENVGKHPRFDRQTLRHGVTNATTDSQQIEDWWNKWPNANIGVATGEKSGVVVVDLDGEEGLASARQLFGPELINSTAAVRTGSGGVHLYFGSEEHINNGVKLLPGLDIRGDGGYVVAPPSLHASGERYHWAQTKNFVDLPEVIINLTKNSNGSHANGATPSAKLEYNEWERLLTTGERNKELARRAGKLLANDIPPSVVLNTLANLNEQYCRPPLPEEELVKMINSLARRDRDRRAQKEYERQQEQSGGKKEDKFSLLTFQEGLHKYGGYELEWDIPGWLPRSTVGLVVAPPGNYKTWILSDLCTAMVGARGFLGHHFVDEPGPVILIQQEDYLPMLLNRIGTMLTNYTPDYSVEDEYEFNFYSSQWPIYIHDQRSFHLSNKEVIDDFREKLRELRPKLVVLDPLYSAVDMKDYMAESAQALLVLKQMRDDFGCNFMIAHHTTKSAGQDRKRDDAWGSQFLNAWLETGWQMRSTPTNGVIEVTRHFKVSQNPAVINLTFNITDWEYEVSVSEESETTGAPPMDGALSDDLIFTDTGFTEPKEVQLILKKRPR